MTFLFLHRPTCLANSVRRSLRQSHRRGAKSVVPSEDYSHAPPRRTAAIAESDGRNTHSWAEKKIMKTTSQNQNQELGVESAQLSSTSSSKPAAPGAVAPTSRRSEAKAEADKKDNRLPIDRDARKQNRTLPTPKVLNLLHTQLPAAYRLAEVVGKWVWVTFKEQPAAEIRQQLAQLGFHWNRDRQAWQHPCGKFSLGSQADPHEKYSAYDPARIRRSAKPQTTAAPAAAAA